MQSVVVTLEKISTLVRICSEESWAAGFLRLSQEFADAPQATKDKIVSLYGGMGSFNDLVLYRDGKLLLSENNELDQLRSELFQLCRRT